MGFVGNKQYNDAEDSGYRIDTSRDLMSRRSLNNDQSLYQLRVENLKTKKLIGSVYIALDEPAVKYLIVQNEDGTTFALTPGSTVECRKLERFTVLSVISNVTTEPSIEAYAENGSGQAKKLVLPALIEVNSETDIKFIRSSDNIGSITFRTSG